jgi:hypothetical protein
MTQSQPSRVMSRARYLWLLCSLLQADYAGAIAT